jgi:hypothetical protein
MDPVRPLLVVLEASGCTRLAVRVGRYDLLFVKDGTAALLLQRADIVQI